MICNVGKTDKVVRWTIGIIIAAAGLYYSSWWGLLAIIPITAAVFGFCPLYVLLKSNTCRKES